MKKVKSLITMAAALALVGCSQDDLMQGVENHADGAIGVNAYVPTTTRGTAVNSVGDLVKSENGFDLFAFKVNSDGESYDESLFMGDGTTGDGVAFIGNGSNGIYTWDYKDNTEKRFWSEAQNATLKFYAVSPMDEVTASMNLEKTLNNTVRKISYSVPSDAKDQVDLMYAVSDKYGSDKNETANKNHMENGISLQFHHALSQIVFKVKTTEKEVFADIKNIEITNIKNSGYFNFDNDYDPLTNTENFWTLDDTKATQKVRMSDTDDEIITDINTHPNEYGYDNETTYSGGYYGSETDGSLTDSKKALLLLPQNLKDNASELVISCRINFSGKNGEVNIVPASNDNEEYAEVRIPLTTEWKPGFKYNYTLIFSAEMGNPIKVETIAVDKWNDTWSDFGDDNINIPQNTVAEVAKDGKFYIYNADQLKDVRDKINQDKSYSFNDQMHRYNEATYILKDNIDLEGKAWTPINGTAHRSNEFGDYTVSTFEGTFDGNGFEIRNLSLNSTEGYYGFFSRVDGTLKNIKIVNDAATLVKFSHEECGVIAGSAHDATVEDCSVNATIQLDKAQTIGGLFGVTNGSDNQGTTVSHCTFEGSITGTGDACGGIAGLVGMNSKVIDCVNKGNASYTYFIPKDLADEENPDIFLAGNGGIAGYVYGIIEHCSNEGNITGYYVGGIEGGRLNGGTDNFMGIIACNNSGTITGTKAGGISYKVEGEHQILKCYNTGLISGTEVQGGIAAAIAGNTLMLGCYNIGTFGNNASAKTAHIVVEDVKYSWQNNAEIINCYWGKEETGYKGVYYSTGDSGFIVSEIEDWASMLDNLNTTDYNEKIVYEGAGIYPQYEYEISGTYPVLLKK